MFVLNCETFPVEQTFFQILTSLRREARRARATSSSWRQRREDSGTMFDSFLLLLQKTLLFAHWDFFRVVASRADKPRQTERTGAEVTAQLERGDLLEVPRTLFVHFGIYLGDGKVAHLIPDILPLLTRDQLRVRAVVSNKRLLLGVLCRRAAVRVDTLEDFVYGARVLLVNVMDGVLGARPAPNEEVARTAEKLVGAVRYSLLWNNCEHFVTFCRYGTGVSLQTDKVPDTHVRQFYFSHTKSHRDEY